MNFAGRSFDLAAHISRVHSWRPRRYPSVDIFLPICGEPIEACATPGQVSSSSSRHIPATPTSRCWTTAPAKRPGRAPGVRVRLRPPPRLREHKKAGNLNYAFARTCSEHIVIFDADFRPRADFLAETLPYMDDPDVGIVQTPQFFRVSRRQTWVERAAGPTLEVFYRAVQVSRDRFGSALCVGSNAVYRRAALTPMAGSP